MSACKTGQTSAKLIEWIRMGLAMSVIEKTVE